MEGMDEEDTILELAASSGYIEFLEERLKSSDYQAETKIRRIDELADLVFTARKNFRRQS